MRLARGAWDGIGSRVVIVGVVAWSGCFPEAPGAKDDTAADDTDTAGVTVPVDTTVSDTAATDAAPDTFDTVDLADGDDTDTPIDSGVVAQSCESDGECTSLAAGPCVVGRCVERVCKAVDISVACDDGDPCTTADRCAAGTCKGRAFNADEAKNWFLQIGGDGEDGAFGVAAHPSGDALVVGGFHGTVSVGGQTIVSDGDKADAFFLRVTPTGVVTRFVRFGDARADVGVLVAADPVTGDTVLAWNTLSQDSQTISATVAWLNDNGTNRNEVTFSGKVVGIQSLEGGDVVGLVAFQGEVTLPLKAGGTLALESGTSTVAVFRLAQGGFDWVRMATSTASASGVQVRAAGARIFSAMVLTEPGAIAGRALIAGPQTIELDTSGGFVSAQALTLRETRTYQGLAALTKPSLEHGLGCGGTVTLVGVPGEPECEVTMGCELAASTPNGAFGVGYPDPSGGMVVVGQQFGSYDYGNDIVGPLGRSATVVRYDDRCQARGIIEERLTEYDDAPPRLRFAVTDTSGLLPRFVTTESGTVILAGFAKGSRSLGGEFDGAVVSVRGSSDALIGAISPPAYFGCSTLR